jgi:hypothetical protein
MAASDRDPGSGDRQRSDTCVIDRQRGDRQRSDRQRSDTFKTT